MGRRFVKRDEFIIPNFSLTDHGLNHLIIQNKTEQNRKIISKEIQKQIVQVKVE